MIKSFDLHKLKTFLINVDSIIHLNQINEVLPYSIVNVIDPYSK